MRNRRLPFVLALSLIAQGAVAAPKGYEKEYKAAVQLENGGSIVDALAAFEAIPVERRDFDTRLHIGSCKRKLGRFLEAELDYEAIRTDPQADEATRDTAASDLEDLRQRIPHLKIALSAGTANVSVTVDGRVVSVPTNEALDPGPHEIVARREGEIVFKRVLQLSEGTAVSVVVDAPGASASGAVAPHVPPRDLAPARDRSMTYGLIASGVALAGLGVGTFFLVRTGNLIDERDALAAEGRHLDALDRAGDARTTQTIARVGVGAGLVAAGAAVYFFVVRPKERPAPTTTGIRLAPVATLGLAIEGSF